MGLAEVAAGGDRAATLRALRDRLAAQIDGSDSGRDVAALAARLTDVLSQLAEVPVEAEGTPLDEFTKRLRDAGATPRRARSAGA